MVNIAQAQRGIVNFIDREIVPKLSNVEKIVVGGGAGILTAKLPQVLGGYPIIASMGLYDKEHGEIDIETAYEAVKPYIGADPIPITIPFVGVTLKMGQREFDSLYRYIMEA